MRLRDTELKRMPATFYDMSTAPLDGTHVKLQLKDGYGLYSFGPCCYKNGKWVNADHPTRAIANKVVGWTHIKPLRFVGASQSQRMSVKDQPHPQELDYSK